MSNCDNCIFRGQWCEKENKCPLFKEDPEFKCPLLKKTRNLKKERMEMSEWHSVSFAPQGWQCPICGAVYSPTTPMCYNCTGKTKTYTVSTGTKEVQSIEEYLKDLERDEGR